MIAAAIFILTFAGLMISYVRYMELDNFSKNSTLATEAVKNQMELIKNTPFPQIVAAHNNTNFAAAGINGLGSVNVNNTNSRLLTITISFSWRQYNGRIIGEDANLNGVLNPGEDLNGNGILDSPVQLRTNVFGG